jgi:replicative DNA helicase
MNTDQSYADLAALMDDALDAVENPVVEPGAIPTGLTALDRMLNGGLVPGQLTVLGGRASAGTSTLAREFARACALRHQLPAYLVTLEHNAADTRARLLCAEADVPLRHVQYRTMTLGEKARLEEQAGVLDPAPLRIDAECYGPYELTRTLQARRWLDGTRLVVIDCVELLEAGAPHREHDLVSPGLKQLAKELGIAVVAVCKMATPDGGGRPVLADFRRTQDLVADADVALILDNPERHIPEAARSGRVSVTVAKHRGGPVGEVGLFFDAAYARFADLDAPRAGAS